MCRGLWLAALVLRQEALQEGHGFVLASYEGGHKCTRTMIFHLSTGPVHCTLINAEDKHTWLRTAALWEVPPQGQEHARSPLCSISDFPARQAGPLQTCVTHSWRKGTRTCSTPCLQDPRQPEQLLL